MILLLSTYELGHQPLGVAWPAAALRQAGYTVEVADLAVDELPVDAVRRARFVGIAAPMHTALRLDVQVATWIRRLNPEAHVCFYGLYAGLNADFLLSTQGSQPAAANSVIGGESESALVQAVTAALAGQTVALAGVSTAGRREAAALTRSTPPVPDRAQLPGLDRYARFVDGDSAVLAGYVESSRGCLHTCRHCPIVPVYHGRFTIVPHAIVMADIRQQVAAGARHISFGDPDFLNGPGHARRLAASLHDEFPGVTFDFTTKVEHLLEHRRLLDELVGYGARFVVSAFESTSDVVLARLHKGHTVADMAEALRVIAAAGLAIQPTWVPFTPWTTLADYLDMLVWIAGQDLITNVPAVQLSVRLLVPPGSALLDHPDVDSWCGPLDPANFVHRWLHPSPAMDRLQAEVAAMAEQAAGSGLSPTAAFNAVAHLGSSAAGRVWTPIPEPAASHAPPRLTEDWFC